MYLVTEKNKIYGNLVVENVWTTKTGLQAQVIFHKDMGHRCGYVAVPTNVGTLNVSHGFDCENTVTEDDQKYLDLVDTVLDVEVHGGFTYHTYDTSLGCLILGFDTLHSSDCPDIDSMKKYSTEEEFNINYEMVKMTCRGHSKNHIPTLKYTMSECEKAANQLKKIFSESQNLLEG